MYTFNEFLAETEVITEAGVRMTKEKWQAAYDAISGTKTSTEFFKNVQAMYGIDTSSQKEYYRASKAFKDIVSGGVSAKSGSPKVKPAPAVPKPATPKAIAKPEPKPEVKATPKAPALKFDTSSLEKKYKQLSSLVRDIESDTSSLVREFNSLRNGQHINNLDTPDLYRLYLTIEGLKYTQPLHDAIKEKLRQAGRLAADAAQYAKTRK